MKRLLLVLISGVSSLGLFAQNSITSDPGGTDAIQKIAGIPTSPNPALYSGAAFSTQFVTTGNSPTTQHLIGIGSLASNSTELNIAILGESSGGSTNYGVVGLARGGGNFGNTGGYFLVESNGLGNQYGLISSVYSSSVLSTLPRYAYFGATSTRTTNNAYGVYVSSENLGSGSVEAGHFVALNLGGGTGDRIGVNSEVLGSSGLNIGIKSLSTGSGDTFGLISEVSGGSTSVAGKFLANSNATNNFQLLLEEKENDYARISFRNINGDGWHQAANKGADATSSQFNFYYVPNASDVLSLRGDGNAILAGTLTQSSDFRLKKNIQPINNASQKIDQIRGVYFNWKNESHGGNTQIGFIAQEMEKVFPELVNTDSKGFKSVAYANMSAVLVEALKEQNQRINALERELAEMKSILKNSLILESKNSK
ncbi:MAG: tail fiber domain-containing protein [Cytophagaceae bacterium]|nr:tail fiber domain-containing protein [Cytophagaceae bacterium]